MLPGPADEDRRHAVVRAVGVLLVVVGVVLACVALADLFGGFDRTMEVVPVAGAPDRVGVDNGPRLVWTFFLGLPLMAVGGGVWWIGHRRLLRPLPAQDACRTCGRHHEADATFCDTCGTRLAPAP
jgi:hypothetical protein